MTYTYIILPSTGAIFPIDPEIEREKMHIPLCNVHLERYIRSFKGGVNSFFLRYIHAPNVFFQTFLRQNKPTKIWCQKKN